MGVLRASAKSENLIIEIRAAAPLAHLDRGGSFDAASQYLQKSDLVAVMTLRHVAILCCSLFYEFERSVQVA